MHGVKLYGANRDQLDSLVLVMRIFSEDIQMLLHCYFLPSSGIRTRRVETEIEGMMLAAQEQALKSDYHPPKQFALFASMKAV